MKKENEEKTNRETKGSSKEKASFDQNGEGASEKFGKAGSKANESGENSPETVKKAGNH